MKKRRKLFLPLLLIVLVGCGRDGGDRVLVNKFQYDIISPPNRFDVVVFKWPVGPVEEGVPKNYIKRLLGLSGEFIAIFFGQLFYYKPGENEPLPYEKEDKDADPTRLWEKSPIDYTHSTLFSLTRNLDAENPDWPNSNGNTRRMKKLFETPGKFDIIRKPPAVMLAMRRIVYDNDFQAKDMPGVQRWVPKEAGWTKAADHRSFQFKDADKIGWLRYQHLLRGSEDRPQLITDFTGYNAFVLDGGMDHRSPENWAGDLMLECDLKVDKAQGEFLMELNRGINRFQARWDLSTGNCTLRQQTDDGPWKDLASKPTDVKSPGSYQLRFANFDGRLVVWVNGNLPFGEKEGDYVPPELRSTTEVGLTIEEVRKRLGPTKADLEQPASLGAGKGAEVEVSHVRLWRDTYYTVGVDGADTHVQSWSDPDWERLRDLEVRTMYVQPKHYLCLGDNSTASSDSRSWGLVPDRLMLGRALMVYWPPSRTGPIR